MSLALPTWRSGQRRLCFLAWIACSACAGPHHGPPPTDAGESLPDGSTPDSSAPDAVPPVTPPPVTTPPGTPPPGKPPSSAPPAFPLEVSASGRFLVDQNETPFLINQASSWGLIQALSISDATSYLDSLSQRGFNTVMVSIISNDVRMAGSPPNWQGTPPFTQRWDFSTWNEAYFAHADEIIRLARARNMLVTLVPAYLGFPSDASQGWADELLNSNNSVEKSRAYGRFLGDRYKDVPNILWIAGGDNEPKAGSELEARLKAIVEGIQERDKVHLWTAHWDGQGDGALSTDNRAFAPLLDLNGYYAFNYDLTYERDLESYTMEPDMPVFHLDMSYEHEGGGSAENIRRKAYGVMLSGGAGSSFNAGPDWYLFYKWRNMDTPGTRETTYWWRLFRSRAWHELVPDRDHKLVTAGYGTFGDVDYVCAALSASQRLAIAYLPGGAAISVNFGMFAGERVQLWWYDPTSGSATSGGTHATDGVDRVMSPSRKSWVLVIDDTTLGLSAPGAG